MSAIKLLWCSVSVIGVLATAGAANADAFKETTSNGTMRLEIEQAYSDDGISNPHVTINGARLRQFTEKQKLQIVHAAKLDKLEDVVVLHHWDGGVGCAGSLTIFSLSEDGFYQSPDLGTCTETYQIDLTDDEGSQVLNITTYSDDAKTDTTGHWIYFDGNLIEK